MNLINPKYAILALLLLVGCVTMDSKPGPIVTTHETTQAEILEWFGQPLRWHTYNKSQVWYYSWGTAYHLYDGIVVGIETWR